DRALQAEAEAEVGDLVVAGIVRGEDLALDAAMAEAARHQDSRGALEPAVQVLLRERLAVDPADLRVDAMGPGCVAERLGDAEIRVRQLDVLADEGDLERRLRRLDPLDERAPSGEVRRLVRIAEAEVADDQPAE